MVWITKINKSIQIEWAHLLQLQRKTCRDGQGVWAEGPAAHLNTALVCKLDNSEWYDLGVHVFCPQICSPASSLLLHLWGHRSTRSRKSNRLFPLKCFLIHLIHPAKRKNKFACDFKRSVSADLCWLSFHFLLPWTWMAHRTEILFSRKDFPWKPMEGRKSDFCWLFTVTAAFSLNTPIGLELSAAGRIGSGVFWDCTDPFREYVSCGNTGEKTKQSPKCHFAASGCFCVVIMAFLHLV